MSNLRTVEFSCPIFGGWQCSVDLDACDSLDDIIRLSVDQLDSWIKQLEADKPNMYGLRNAFTDLKPQFESHCGSFVDILLGDPTVSVCICACHPPAAKNDARA